MLQGFDKIVWRNEPYRIGLVKPALAEAAYSAMVDAFPDESMMGALGKGYHKLALSEKAMPAKYESFVNGSLVWLEFHRYIKSAIFRAQMNQAVGLGSGKFRARWEFSSMPSNGGRIDPHTDIVSKVLTLIIPIVRPGEWNAAWGGGTDVLRPLDPAETLVDYQAPLAKFKKVATYEFEPNQCVVFLKSENSWHSVLCCGPAGKWRRSLTINVERAK